MAANYPEDPSSIDTTHVFPDPTKYTPLQLCHFVNDRVEENATNVALIKERVHESFRRTKRVVTANCVDGMLRARVRVETEEVPVKTVLESWKPDTSLFAPVDDKFEHDLEWNIDSFAKCIAMNDKIRKVAKCYTSYYDAEVAKHQLLNLLKNVTYLGRDILKLLQCLKGVSEDDVEAARMKAEYEMNASLDALVRKHSLHPAESSSHEPLESMREAVAGAAPPTWRMVLRSIGVTHSLESQLWAWVSESRGMSVVGPLALQYKATRDGWEADDFRRVCNGKGSMLFIVRSSEGYLFGGYTSVGFKAVAAGTNAPDANAFVFTLHNPHDIPATRFKCTRVDTAICNWPAGDARGITFVGGFRLVTQCNNKPGSGVFFPSGYYEDTTGKGDTLFTGTRDAWTATEVLGFQV